MTYRNDHAARLWAFSAITLLIVATMSFLFVRDGIPPDASPAVVPGAMLMFWILALGLSWYAASRPCLRFTVHPDRTITLTRRYPLHQSTHTITPAELHSVTLIESWDSEASPYFHARMSLTDGTNFDLAEGHSRARCAATVAEFKAVIDGRISASEEA